MAQDGPTTDRLDSWKEIAAYVGRDVRTVIRWEQKGGLPIYRVPVGERQAVYAYRHEIDEWMKRGAPGSSALATLLEVTSDREAHPERSTVTVAAPPVAEPSQQPPLTRFRLSPRTAIWLASAAVVLGAALSLYADFAPRHFALDGATQITSDGSQKTGLVTNGTNLYFGEMREGRIVLSTVPVSGGPVREIPTPFIRAEPQDISRDGTRLLVLAGEGGEHERSLWTLPLHGGKPSRVGDLLCHSAAWSPDDRHIAFGYGNAVYLTTGNGATPRLLHTFTGVPLLLRWSLDGRRIFVQLRDSATWNAFLWELTLDGTDDSRVSSLAPASFTLREYDAVSNVLNRNDDLLVSSGKTIWIMQKKRMPWQSGFNLTELSTEMSGYGALAVDVNARRLYVTKETPAKNELDWFDGKSHQFRPFLPGISARDVDFSRDGERIAYVRERENTLWIGDAHGAAAQQIATPGMLDIELPRWSPDGKQIAFMGKLADSPYRIFVANKVTGRPREASRGSDNQGAPTWSPDGRHLVYGEVWCQETKTCAIEQIDLATGQQTRVPGSEGLSTARWSPDGRFIAALRTDLHEVWLQDCRTRIWRKLADANGDNLAWAPDSKAIYASNPNGDRPEVIRISLKDGKVEPAVDLSDFSKLSGRIDTWFSVTPDNSILFLHIFSAHEIYSWRYFEN